MNGDFQHGTRDCRAELVLDFLTRTHCDTLYLVGDIIDLESLKRSVYWPPAHTEVLRAILAKSQLGTRVVYVPGNHDDALALFTFCLAAAREAKLDGVVCGHIHKPELRERDGLLYCNDGDWVETCTAIVEDRRGKLALVAWPLTQAAEANIEWPARDVA
jgi:UDP-2,3-diacylglucosamine pyrophosphatase LpxH